MVIAALYGPRLVAFSIMAAAGMLAVAIPGVLSLTLSNPMGISNVLGSPYDDTIIGNARDNTLIGGAGDDLVIGGDGRDVLVGGTGSGGGADDTVLLGAATVEDVTDAAFQDSGDALPGDAPDAGSVADWLADWCDFLDGN